VDAFDEAIATANLGQPGGWADGDMNCDGIVDAADLAIITGTVSCPADFNGDTVVNFFDVLAYTAAFNAGDASADLAAPVGTLNFFDFLAFVSQFNAGCP
jgi:hypothetical protein